MKLLYTIIYEALFIIYLIASPKTVSWCCIHRTNSATCTQPQTCHRCGKTWGEAKGHTWINATCTESKYCSICKITEGNALGHSWKAATYEVNYVGGIDQYFTFKNKSETKTINYITMKIQFNNALNDVLYDEITRLDYATLVYTGPLYPGKSSGSKYWRACFYNSTFGGTINFVEIKIEYSDGTTLILDDYVADEVVVAWR